MRTYFAISIFLFFATVMAGQVNNDECIYAQSLGSIIDYCSGDMEFSNVGATPSAQVTPDCFFGGSDTDVWFTFSPTSPGIYIQMTGSTLKSPSIVVYEGSCSNLVELGCQSTNSGSISEITLDKLTIGKTYFLRVDARNLQVGTFKLCLKSFIPVPKPESDCISAVVLCDKSPFQVENLNSTGDVQNELTGPCVQNGQEQERASVFYKWVCEQSGTLTFTITPNNPNNAEEDIDFVVYEFPGGLDDCENRVGVRCMLSGETANTPSSPCFGPTGLAEGETDISESAGCSPGDNNFVAPLDMVSGKTYGMIINNFSQSGFGFSIEWGGTGTFQGPEADFDIIVQDAFECDKSVVFEDQSMSVTDPIVSLDWNFGVGANPQTAIGPGPHTTVFESFGPKVAVLTVESSKGCLVSKIIDFYVNPCCKDTSTLDVTADIIDLACNGDNSGEIIGQGVSGSPDYTYSLDGSDFQLNPRFSGLPAGDYEIFVQDQKGCKDSLIVSVSELDPTIVDAGPDITVDLGYSGQAMADVSTDPSVMIDDISWSPLDSFLTCKKCLDPEILPPGETTYSITVTDSNGCTDTDEVTFYVNIVRPFYAPDIFSPNDDGVNDFFNVFGGKAIKRLELLEIYDRWGNLIYQGSPDINDPTQGWDGRFNDQPVNPGVYAWVAKVLYVDNVTLHFAGDITVIR